jgi:hypothetical protein
MNAAADGGSGFVQTLIGSAEFLKYGSIGLAGLMLVLVVAALAIRQTDARTTALLRTFMFVGAFCFVVSTASTFAAEVYKTSHLLFLKVIPIEMTGSDLPAPVVSINNENQPIPLRYPVVSDITAIVDVNEAVNKLREVKTRLNERQGTLNEKEAALAVQIDAVQRADVVVSRMQESLTKLASLAVADSCPGGPHGVPSNHAADIAELKDVLVSDAATVKSVLSSIGVIGPGRP